MLFLSVTLMMCCIGKSYSLRMCILECLTYCQRVYLVPLVVAGWPYSAELQNQCISTEQHVCIHVFHVL